MDYIKSLEQRNEELEENYSKVVNEFFEFKKKTYLDNPETCTLLESYKHNHLEAVKFYLDSVNHKNIHDDNDLATRVAHSLYIEGIDRNYFTLMCDVYKGNIHANDDEIFIKSCVVRDFNLVKYFVVDLKTDIHVLDDEPLRAASFGGHREIVEFLLNNGAFIHAEDDKASRAAAYYGHFDTFKCLVEHGANIHAQNGYALIWAKHFGHVDIVNYIEQIINKNTII